MTDLTIKDVPDVDSVKDEIINNALTSISNYHKSQLPKSEAEIAVEATIEAVKDKNPLFTKIAVNEAPIELPLEEPLE